MKLKRLVALAAVGIFVDWNYFHFGDEYYQLGAWWIDKTVHGIDGLYHDAMEPNQRLPAIR